MRLKLSVRRPELTQDVLATLDSAATIGDLAHVLATREPNGFATLADDGVTLLVHSDSDSDARPLDPELPIVDSSLRSGTTVSISPASNWGRDVAGPARAQLRITSGPDAGREFVLHEGLNHIGRTGGCEVRLSDPTVSKRHARLHVHDTVDIVDLGSNNGILVDGTRIQRATLTADNTVVVGNTHCVVIPVRTGASGTDSSVEFNRSPHVQSPFEGGEIEAPEPPERIRRFQFPLISMIAPLLVGGVMYAVTRNAFSLVFVALSPLLILGSLVDQHRHRRRDHRESTAAFEEALEQLGTELGVLRDLEVTSRLQESPSVADAIDAAERLSTRLWLRRTDQPGFLTVRFGLGSVRSRTHVALPRRRSAAEHWNRLTALQHEYANVHGVPIVADFLAAGGVGVAGPRDLSHGVARNLVVQLVCQHSPAEVSIAAIGGASISDWDWLKWLPHVDSGYGPLTAGSLTNSTPGASALLSRLEGAMAARAARRSESVDESGPQGHHVVLLVIDDAPVDRSRLVQLAETGPTYGVHVMWVAHSIARIPACCRAFVELDSGPTPRIGLVHAGAKVEPVQCESVEVLHAQRVARRLAPVVDSAALVQDVTDLPRAVSFLSVTGSEIATDPDAVVSRWRDNDPVLAGHPDGIVRPLALRGAVGQGVDGPFHLDLRTDGPHALVGGTTGSGKSEFLQTWVLGMAANQGPQRLTFLFVDYKGGSAFASCVDLPHTVGLVTDLRPHLVRRALTSLRAEVRHREHILAAKTAKDLVDLEKSGDPDSPPSLIIVVDEFAALIQEVPEFIDGVVDVAQRGRSLGLHLILATQQPSGVIRGNLRANTNLRVALRVSDRDDSTDVIGDPMAAGFDPSTPGRAAARTGPGRVNLFQSLYVGGTTPHVLPRPSIDVESLNIGARVTWPPHVELGERAGAAPTEPDIERIVAQMRAATTTLGLPVPRKPWLEPLAPMYDLARLSQRRDNALVIGVVDDPQSQRQLQAEFRPDDDGNMAIYGTGGAGKSTALRSLALAAAITPDSGPCDVYALDFGSRGLAMLEGQPHVGAVINGDDHERVARLMRWLRGEVDTRARAFAAARAGDLTEYRELADQPELPRVLLLLDGMSAFRHEYELGPRSAVFTTLSQLASDGRPVGIHLVVTADRPASIPTSLSATIQQRLVLRMADDGDYALLNVPSDLFNEDSPPGRGMINGLEVQVAVLGGSANITAQSRAAAELSAVLERRGRRVAPPIRSLADRIQLGDLPLTYDGRPTIGMRDDTLEPYGVDPRGTFLIVGPPGSGRTTTVTTLVRGTGRAAPDTVGYLFCGRRSPLLGIIDWAEVASTEDEALVLAARLQEEIVTGRLVPTPSRPVVLVIDAVASFYNGLAEPAMQALVSTADEHDVFVVADSEISTVTQSWALGAALRARRRGIALQPDDMDGTQAFRTTFPRIARSEFPPGRGLVTEAGATVRVQIALPE